MIDFSLIASTFGIIFLAELPDKTALATTMISSGYSRSSSSQNAFSVWLGVCLAFLIHTTIATLMGHWVSALIDPKWMRMISGVVFLIFAYLNWTASRQGESSDDSKRERFKAYGPFIQSFLIIFVAEAGDMTQLTTLMLAANQKNTISIFIGAITALASVAAIAVSLGQWIGQKLPQKKIKVVSAFIFLIIAVLLLNPLNWF